MGSEGNQADILSDLFPAVFVYLPYFNRLTDLMYFSSTHIFSAISILSPYSAPHKQRDIRSPIILAQQKQAQKLGLPQSTTQDLLPKIKPANEQSTTPTKGSLQPSRRGDEGVTPNGSGFPELPSPGFRDGESGRSAGVIGSGTVIDREGNIQNVTYAVAIYP